MSRETNINPLAAALYPRSLQDWTEFSKKLETAINAQLPSQTQPYNEVNVLLICFEEDDLGCIVELEKLVQFLTDSFRFNCEIWKIPTGARKIG